MVDTEDQVRRRRERGRRSQSAFRKRQAQASKDLGHENQRLKEAIHRVLTASRGGSRPELLNTIHDLADAAGIDADTPPSYDIAEGTSDVDLDIDVSARDFSQEYRQHSSPSYSTLDLASRQRLSCGIWLDPFHYTRISLPPEDLIPYLGSGSTTFAGLIFWSVMDHCRGEECKQVHSKPAVMIQRGLAHSKAIQDIKPSFIQDMVEARVEYKKMGSINPKYAAAAERDLSAVVRGQVEDDYRARGKDSAQWLSCVAIENRVRSIVGSTSFVLLEKAASGQGDPALRELMGSVKCRLYDSSICFGDGPRWNIDVVDELFLECIGTAWRLV